MRHLYLKVNVSFFLFCFIHPSLFFYSAVYYKSVCFYHKIQSYNVKDFWLLIPLSCFLYHMSLCIIIYILYCILQKDSSYKLSTILGCLFHYIVLLYSRAAPNNRLSDWKNICQTKYKRILQFITINFYNLWSAAKYCNVQWYLWAVQPQHSPISVFSLEARNIIKASRRLLMLALPIIS